MDHMACLVSNQAASTPAVARCTCMPSMQRPAVSSGLGHGAGSSFISRDLVSGAGGTANSPRCPHLSLPTSERTDFKVRERPGVVCLAQQTSSQPPRTAGLVQDWVYNKTNFRRGADRHKWVRRVQYIGASAKHCAADLSPSVLGFYLTKNSWKNSSSISWDGRGCWGCQRGNQPRKKPAAAL